MQAGGLRWAAGLTLPRRHWGQRRWVTSCMWVDGSALRVTSLPMDSPYGITGHAPSISMTCPQAQHSTRLYTASLAGALYRDTPIIHFDPTTLSPGDSYRRWSPTPL